MSDRGEQIIAMVKAGLSRREMAERLGMSKRSIDNFLQRRSMRTHGCLGTRRGRLKTGDHCLPLVRELIAKANDQQARLDEIAARAGVKRGTISDWRYSRVPRLDLFVAAANALGYDVVLRESKP